MSSPAEIVVTGVGMRCSVGQNAPLSAAAVRAGISRFAEWMPLGEEGPIVAAAVEPDLGDRDWIEKLDALATQPLMEALWTAGLPELATPSGIEEPETERGAEGPFPWKLYLATPERGRPGVSEESETELDEDVADGVLLSVEPPAIALYPEGNTGALSALAKASAELAAGVVEVAVVGGVDSLLQEEYLVSLLETGRLKTEKNPAGLIPGEAAAFLVVETQERATARGAEILARLGPVRRAIHREPAEDEPLICAAYTAALRAAVADLPGDPANVHRVIADVNGERGRFREWGTASARALNYLAPDLELWNPADSLGDIGAATGVAYLCLAVRAFRRGYAAGDAILVATAADHGRRAVTGIRPA
jgi:3-oxoacyl-[acyl-carrier-protein] synthase-1